MPVSGGRLERGSSVGGYRVDELIGRGGMGMVYRVTNVALNRIYALKVLTPELAEDDQFRLRFQREMRVAASLHHPHVVAIHYAGEQEGMLFLAMDYVPGTDLREVVKKDGALDPDRAVELLTQVASALDAAHVKGLVHRDIKPANIMLAIRDGEEHAYLTDFGLAKRHDSYSGLTLKGSMIGTVDYMAPEQVTGDPTDARTDVYALGCVFYQMLTGKVPYERENSIATLFAHAHDPPPSLDGPLAETYPELREVIDRAMAKQPSDRFLSAGDFARAAAAALRGVQDTGGQTMVATGEARPVELRDPATAEHGTTATSPGPPRATVVGAGAPATAASATLTSAGPTEGGPPAAGGPSPLRRYRWPLAGLVVLIVAAVVVIALASGGSTPAKPVLFEAVLQPVPLNHVTGSGTAAVRLQGNKITVTLDTTGLINAPHALHIHAFGQGVCPPASAAGLFNGHRAISTTDGAKFFGPMAVALTTSGDTGPGSMLASSRYPATGDIHYQRTIAVSDAVAKAIRNANAVVVVHGIDYNHNGRYDNVLNRSELDGAQSQEATAPALCGTLVNAKTVGESG